MAKGGGGWWYKGNADFDRRPGGSGESRQYARTYNVRSETEFTNRPETASQIREFAILTELERERRRRRENDAQSRVHVFPSVGKFLVPEHKDNWAVHIGMIKDKGQNLGFSPERYVYFDKIIAEKLGKNSPVVNPKHPDYARYEGLRNNLAVMRNDIIGLYLDDKSFDPGDEKYLPYIVSIATTLADGLANDSWFKRPFAPTVSIDVANVEGTGAHEMYTYLLSMQTKKAGKLEEVRRRLVNAFGFTNRSWGLPPIEETPFSLNNLAAPLPQETPAAATPPPAIAGGSEPLLDLSMAAILAAGATQSIETLVPPAREASVEEARTILRWLRNLQFGDRDMEEWITHGTPPERLAKAEAVARLTEIYSGLLYQTAQEHPDLMRNLDVEDANNAAGTMARSLAVYSASTLPPEHPGAGELQALLTTMPAGWSLRQAQSVDQLLDTLESGFGRIAAGPQPFHEKPAVERLLDMSDRITAAAYRLRSVDTMQEPAREESIELAREILRRMKNLRFSDTPLDELNRHGTPEDKAALAQKLDEMVDIYKNLLFEAAEINPGILHNARVKAANDAVGSFAHAITLMAAKEIPASIAAAQQISADVTQMPEEWKGLHGRTVGRLVASMEGGLEAAVDEMMAEQAEGKDEEIAEEVIEASLHSEAARRKRRRKRRHHSHGGGGKQLKAHLALTADDYVLKQGRFREEGGSVPSRAPDAAPMIDRPVVPPIAGLSENDLAVIRNLGSSLRDIGNQASALPPAPADEKIVPDDKTLAMREQEQRNKPKRPRDRM